MENNLDKVMVLILLVLTIIATIAEIFSSVPLSLKIMALPVILIIWILSVVFVKELLGRIC